MNPLQTAYAGPPAIGINEAINLIHLALDQPQRIKPPKLVLEPVTITGGQGFEIEVSCSYPLGFLFQMQAPRWGTVVDDVPNTTLKSGDIIELSEREREEAVMQAFAANGLYPNEGHEEPSNREGYDTAI